MPAPINQLKKNLLAGQPQYGFWQSIHARTTVEISAQAGFDFLVIDNEHASVAINHMADSFAFAQPHCQIVARPVIGESWLIKQLCDAGAQNFLIPMVESPEQATSMVEATRYPPHGIRGVAGMSRAAAYSRNKDYFAHANNEMCVIAQIETKKGYENLDSIVKTDGVDVIFIGPADLSAALGYLG